MDTVLSMDELLPSKVERKEAGEISRVHDQPAIVTEATQEQSSTVNENDSISSKAEKFRKLKGSASVWLQDQDRNGSPKIRKVIYMLRKHKNFEKYCEPKVISIGPIHHGKPKYEIAEEYKLMLTNVFIGNCGKDVKDVYEAVENNIKQLREHFDEEVTKGYDDETLSWMLFVDGCALLQYMYSFNRGMFYGQQITKDLLVFARQDLFLLENQLPYQLLQDLMNLSTKKEDFEISIGRFIQEHGTLYLYRKELYVLRRENPSWRPIHLLDLLRAVVLGSLDSHKIAPSGSKKEFKSIPNVQKLKAAGIHLKYGLLGLRTIVFSRLFNFYRGILWVPQIIVNDSTGPMLFNLIAYEMSPDFENEFGITSYISFLNSIIKEADDVTELRKARIVNNFFGSDQEVAQLFKEIGMGLLPNPKIHSLVKYQILKYYEGKLSRICQFAYQYYKNPPWTVIGIVLSIVALVVTAIQTWLTAIQTGSSGSGKG